MNERTIVNKRNADRYRERTVVERIRSRRYREDEITYPAPAA